MVLGAVSGEMISCKYCAPPPSSTSCILHLVTLPNITTFLRMVDTETLDHITSRPEGPVMDRRAGDYEVQTK